MTKLNLQLFAVSTVPQPIGATEVYNTPQPINVTTQTTMNPTMKTFYDTSLLENAREKMVFSQLGKKQPLKGKTVEWRKLDTFPKAQQLTEGVVPAGQTFGMSAISASVDQYGDYVAISDRLELESYDDIIFGATEEMGAAEGETFDTLTRDIISAGNNVSYCPKISSSGVETAVGATSSLDATAILTPKMVAKIATKLKKAKAPTFDGSTYVAVIHPSQAYDLRESAEWKEFHKYADVAPIFNGEIGTLHGVRFIVSNNVKVEKAGANGVAVYYALFMGKDAFGVLDPQGEGMEMIIKDRHQAGGPLDQFSTIGYKFCHGAAILYPERLVRVESGSSYSADDAAN